ncbi:MAG TPA: hypothetical protein VNK41_12765 [Vicinamibacterales bacterium]|nr:hypothetical protein [Vicinamibacterales bacterium]
MSVKSTRRQAVAAACVATWFLLAGSSQASAQRQQPKLDDAERAEAQELVNLVEKASAGDAAGTGLTLTWGQHYFIKAQGEKTYVPFTVAVTADTPVNSAVGFYLRVVARSTLTGATDGGAAPAAKREDTSKAAAPEFAFEDLYFFDLPGAAPGQPRRVSRAFAVPPGDYDIYVAIKERASRAAKDATPRSGVLRQSLTVPEFNTPGLKVSSVIVAERIDMLETPIDPESQAEHPFTFGQMQITPAAELKFSKKDELTLVFWIYGAQNDPATKKPNVQVEYKFHQIKDGGETYFNRTEPQLLNAETLPPQFDLAVGHQLSGSLAVGLTSFPEGDYRLAIEVQDKAASAQATTDVKFTVVP